MMNKRSVWIYLLICLMLLIGNGCSPSEPAAAGSSAETPQESTDAIAGTEEDAVSIDESSTSDETGTNPETGGTFIWAISTEPDSLDAQKTSLATSDWILQFLGGSLVWLQDGVYSPYLAETWETSEDGLVWTFNLREDVTFQDGTPLKATDYVWTLNRLLDPETASPVASLLGNVAAVEEIGDYSFSITLAEPNFPILYALSDPGYMQPLLQSYIEELGEEAYSRQPIGVGPYSLVEWSTGEKITLQRNPNYQWGPAALENTGPYYLETIEFTIIPEYSTIIAGLEAGEIDYAQIETMDVQRLSELGTFQLIEKPVKGIMPFVSFNLTEAPFNDIRVRQAMNMAVDKDAMIKLVVQGNGVVQNGYLSSTVAGYWSGVEDLAYSFDLDAARALLLDAGYVEGTDGWMEKDGEPLQFTLYTPQKDMYVKTAEILQEQMKQIGVELSIERTEMGILYGDVFPNGKYQIAISAWLYGEADLLFLNFHSSGIGGLNIAQLTDPAMDSLLEQSRSATDPATRQEVVNEVQRIIAEQAFVIPLFTPIEFSVVNQRVTGVKPFTSEMPINLSEAYISE